ncbi:50S ribosomal protein L2, partial [Campylobacter jejuni]
GTIVHNFELKPGKGGKMIPSEGVYVLLIGKVEKYVIFRLASCEMGQVFIEWIASIGVSGNEEGVQATMGKEGRNRHRSTRT